MTRTSPTKSADNCSLWLLDLGNSRVKLATLAQGSLSDIIILDWSYPHFVAELRNRISGLARPKRILIASVARADHAVMVQNSLVLDCPVSIEWVSSPRTACGVINHYSNPSRLGVDRFLSMVAVHAQPERAGIVIGCGTALTLDAITADGNHIAGLISLSPDRMMDALRSGINLEVPPSRTHVGVTETGATDMEEHQLEGCWAAACALVEWFVKQQRPLLGDAPVWLHGGGALPLASWLMRDGCVVDVLEQAVLKGLAIWANSAKRPA